MSTALLSVQKLSFYRQDRALLRDLSFTLEPGELVGVIGPNGAGKSTLLKLLVDYYQPTEGSISLSDTPLASLSHPERARRISYMAQHSAPSLPFLVRDVIALGAHSRQASQIPSAQVLRNDVAELAEQLELTHLLDRKLTELSGGENQLVQFARILMQQAPLMLLDEPTASLDIGHEAQLMNLLRRHCERQHSALVAIHNLNIAAVFCDRLLLLDKGRLIASGTPEQVITQANMAQLYQQQVTVSQHPVTGTVTVLPVKQAPTAVSLHVHLIGGAGSTVALARWLLQRGVTVSGGIGHEQDSDTDFWTATGMRHIAVPAFAPIDQDAIDQAQAMVESADLTIVCDFPIGAMNEGNLILAGHAKLLWLLQEDTETAHQRFYSEAQAEAFAQLQQQGVRLTALAAIEQLTGRIGELSA
ncbi:MAG: iron complex transport system ATP-binding protein [Reinekea sp.]|jgi:iron complex transport system ATP-binding protein